MGLPRIISNFQMCNINKMHLITFTDQFEHVSHPLDCVHIDLVGPINPPSVSGFRYFLTIVDQATSYKMIQLLKHKSDALEQFVIVKKEMETLHDQSLKKVVSDCGGEFLNEKFKSLSEAQGFTHIFSPANTPQHNGFAERAKRTILEKARCILNGSNLPDSYWAEAINTSKILSKIIPTPSRRNLSPYMRAQDQSAITWGNYSAPTEMVDEAHLVIADLADEARSAESFEVIPERAQEEVDEPLASPDDNGEEEDETPSITRSHIKVIVEDQKALITSASDCPRTYKKELASVDKALWEMAIKKELQAMNDLNVWDVVYLKSDYKLVGTTWVFRIKRNHLNEVTEHKARLCAQGFTQTPGLDFDKTYSPTGCLNSLQTLIAFAASRKLEFHQVDVKSAFLNAPLAEIVYLSIPQGLNLDQRKYCLKLNKAIYGLKQAPLAWYERLQKWLIKSGFSSCILDPCVFFWNGQIPTLLYIHVDDIAIFSSDASVFKKEIACEFDIKDIGPADLMLGVKVSRTDTSITLDQHHFTEALLDLYGLLECKTVSTPLIPNTHMSVATLDEIEKFKLLGVNYCSAVGSINYLSTATRPDLSHRVSCLSQFLESPGIQHWNGFLHVLRYLKGTQDLGLVYSSNQPQGITSYSNADWGYCQQTRRSVTGYLATFDGSLVLWKTWKQPTVSLSTAGAEYKAVCDLASELLWLQQWCQECRLCQFKEPIPIYEDNQSCINVVNGNANMNNKRMKHVNIQLHFIKEVVDSSKIKLVYVPTKLMLADFLTKGVFKITIKAVPDRQSATPNGNTPHRHNCSKLPELNRLRRSLRINETHFLQLIKTNSLPQQDR
ncbi:hypothetical protein O181_038881 [Austropuccinia psidii MF-1]|uniref:Integrase catalytic domain-containing protein n=1 Tax=Austropuccinia psidii MF-1 TaxID=1389203 RepID=A0A9Q3HC14_9BASI|nr:hypothetical protein [Austropuccinia psidii MF-1]